MPGDYRKSEDIEGHYNIVLPMFRAPKKNVIREVDAQSINRICGRAELLRVTSGSLLAERKAVYRVAQFFRREFSYDVVQYHYAEDEPEDALQAYLWFVEASGYYNSAYAIGACCFRWRDWHDAPKGWAMQWIWMHPYERRRGHLRASWDYFQKQYGDFELEPPLSPAMAAFVKSVANKER